MCALKQNWSIIIPSWAFCTHCKVSSTCVWWSRSWLMCRLAILIECKQARVCTASIYGAKWEWHATCVWIINYHFISSYFSPCTLFNFIYHSTWTRGLLFHLPLLPWLWTRKLYFFGLDKKAENIMTRLFTLLAQSIDRSAVACWQATSKKVYNIVLKNGWVESSGKFIKQTNKNLNNKLPSLAAVETYILFIITIIYMIYLDFYCLTTCLISLYCVFIPLECIFLCVSHTNCWKKKIDSRTYGKGIKLIKNFFVIPLLRKLSV